MKEGFIAVIDSGIGGIAVLRQLALEMPNENFLYYGDNDNAPYGNKSKRELKELSIKNLDYILRYPIKAIVLACNTLSVNVLNDVIEYSGLPVFGVFPPIEKSVVEGGRTLLLSTVATASCFNSNKWCDVVGFTTLADEIEKNAFNLSDIDFDYCLKNKKVGKVVNKKCHYKTVILGCTHYELIKNKIADHFCPEKIINGSFFTVKTVSNFFKNQETLVNHYRNQILFIGKNAKFNELFFNFGGQKD